MKQEDMDMGKRNMVTKQEDDRMPNADDSEKRTKRWEDL